MNDFGLHLMMDCKTLDNVLIGNLSYIFNFINTLPEKIGMTKITQPYVFPYSGLKEEDKGITGTVIIAESHISIHTFTEKNYFFIDLFSCKTFGVERVLDIIVETFNVTSYEHHLIKRGVNFNN